MKARVTTAGEPLPGQRQPPLNLRYVEPQVCVTCISGGYENDVGPTFLCCRPNGPRWKGGEETEHVCDLWKRLEEE